MYGHMFSLCLQNSKASTCGQQLAGDRRWINVYSWSCLEGRRSPWVEISNPESPIIPIESQTYFPSRDSLFLFPLYVLKPQSVFNRIFAVQNFISYIVESTVMNMGHLLSTHHQPAKLIIGSHEWATEWQLGSKGSTLSHRSHPKTLKTNRLSFKDHTS